MTTRIQIKVEGPDELIIRYYNEKRQFTDLVTRVQVGEEIHLTIWDGHIPVMWAIGHGTVEAGEGRFYAVPPATGA